MIPGHNFRHSVGEIPGMSLMVNLWRGIHQVIHYRVRNTKNLFLRHFLEIHIGLVKSVNGIIKG